MFIGDKWYRYPAIIFMATLSLLSLSLNVAIAARMIVSLFRSCTEDPPGKRVTLSLRLLVHQMYVHELGHVLFLVFGSTFDALCTQHEESRPICQYDISFDSVHA